MAVHSAGSFNKVPTKDQLRKGILSSRDLSKEQQQLALIGLAFEGIITEPMGSTDLGIVHEYCIKRNTVKVSYLGFGGNSKDSSFSWEIDAVKFRGRGILHFTGRNTYNLLGLAQMTNRQLDEHFSTIEGQLSSYVRFCKSTKLKGTALLHAYTGSSSKMKATTGYKVRRIAFDGDFTPVQIEKLASGWRSGKLDSYLSTISFA